MAAAGKKGLDMFCFSAFICEYCSLGKKVVELCNYFRLIYLLCAKSILVVSNYICFHFKVLVSIRTNKVSLFLSVTCFVSLCCLLNNTTEILIVNEYNKLLYG